MKKKSVTIKLSNILGIDADRKVQLQLFAKIKPMLEHFSVPEYIHTTPLVQRVFISYELILHTLQWYLTGTADTHWQTNQNALAEALDNARPMSDTSFVLRVPESTLHRIVKSTRSFDYDMSIGTGLKLLELIGKEQVYEFCEAVEKTLGVDISHYAYSNFTGE